MGFLYCPICGKGVSDQAKIAACPNDFHPFNAAEWRRIDEQKKDEEEKEKKVRRQVQVANSLAGLCHCGGSFGGVERITLGSGVIREYKQCLLCGSSKDIVDDVGRHERDIQREGEDAARKKRMEDENWRGMQTW